MATNPYFKSSYFGAGEQSLINALNKEAIQVQGYDINYMPRETVNLDYLYGEDAASKFGDAIPLEAYIVTTEGYGGVGDTLAKFGLDIQDDLTLQIHIDRFSEEITTKFGNIIRPREGDLIYLGLDKHSVFEITFVENKKPYYQAGNIYIYELSLKRFVYGAENIHTEVFDIDDMIEHGSMIEITLGTLQSTSNAFIPNEVVFQSPTNLLSNSIASGIVSEVVDNVLFLHQTKGNFVSGLSLIGNTSGTKYSYPIKSDTTFDDTSSNKLSNNISIRKESNSIIDYDESNPFGENEYN